MGAKQDYSKQVPKDQQSPEHYQAWLSAAKKAGVYNPDGSPRAGSGGKAEYKDTDDYSGGSDESGMRAHSKKHGMSEDYARFDDATLALWEKQKDPGCPPTHPYQSYNGTGCAEKPIDSGLDSPGRGKKGGKGGRGGGGGGGKGGGKGGVPGGGGGPQDLALYQLKKTYADALSDPTGNKAWQLFAGQGGQKGFQGVIDRQRAEMAGMPPGPARDRMELQLKEMERNAQIQMPQQATQMALSGLSGVMQPELGYVGSERDRDLGWFGAKTDRMLGQGQLDLGWGGLDLQGELGRGDLGLRQGAQDWQQGAAFDWEKDRFKQGLEHDKAMQKGAKPSTLEKIGGFVGGILSDIRTKENIAPGRRGLTDLRKLGTYSYNYKADPVKTPHQGVMAQDLEKVAPEMVTEDETGTKFVDGYAVLSMTLKAVQELDKKIAERRKEKK
jgi:hypothetical protein